jgi:hypothetical protein
MRPVVRVIDYEKLLAAGWGKGGHGMAEVRANIDALKNAAWSALGEFVQCGVMVALRRLDKS